MSKTLAALAVAASAGATLWWANVYINILIGGPLPALLLFLIAALVHTAACIAPFIFASPK